MKARIQNPFFVPALLVVTLGLLLAGRVSAQTFKTLYSFTLATGMSSTGYSTSSDGRNPYAGLTFVSNSVFGTANSGGQFGWGTVFGLNTDGTGFKAYYPFSMETYVGNGISTNLSGGNPQAPLVFSGTALFGTASQLGAAGNGTVFGLSPTTGFALLHSFTPLSASYLVNGTNSDGANPEAGLVLSGSSLYGTAQYGGVKGYGTIFKVDAVTKIFTNLHSFAAMQANKMFVLTNGEGAYPLGGLLLAGATLYGASSAGGLNGNGTIFAMNTDGTGFTNLHSFFPLVVNANLPLNSATNFDGAYPTAELILVGGTLYGTASRGGLQGDGTVFAINTNGSGFTTLHSFAPGNLNNNTSGHDLTNSDGSSPRGGLVASGATLYGTAAAGGTNGNGTIFSLGIDGSNFATLHVFSATVADPDDVFTNGDGVAPLGGLILSSNTLYGTAAFGGNEGDGTVFSISVLPQLAILHAGTNIVLTWPTNVTGFTLESTTNLAPPEVWITNASAPLALGGRFTVTNPISGSKKFYRLIQ